jgi:predicted metalloprotease
MKWREGRRSDNVEVSSGGGRGGGVGRLGIGGVAVVVVVSLLLGKNPLEMLGLVSQMTGGQEQAGPPPDAERVDFVSAILGETEDVWGGIFEASKLTYERPKLTVFSGEVATGCGGGSAAMGPFYCPNDHKVYLDVTFFDEMKARLGGGGDFANAYVIAHEVGHHVQTLLGVSDRMAQARQSGQAVQGDNGLSVRQELQADCYAGVWAHVSDQRHHWLEQGDVETALNTASAIGDDRLQKQSGGRVVPDAFTHGTSEQRVRWFKAGFASGDPNACDTFKANPL